MDITWEVIAAALTVISALAAVWWRVEGMVRRNTDDLAAHKLHVSESYVSKQGLREVTDQIMEAISGVGAQISEMRGRIDRVFDKPPTPRTRA